jgi:predicted alpha/beta superfamily hydrolase
MMPDVTSCNLPTHNDAKKLKEGSFLTMFWFNTLYVIIAGISSLASSAAAKIELRVLYPGSIAPMYIRGDGCGLNWSQGVRMSSLGNSTWSTYLDCSSNVTGLEVKALLDDRTWMLGGNHRIALSDPTSFVVYPWFHTYHGSLEIIKNVYSPELRNSRDVIVYLPPSYKENTLKPHRNVLVMHDGQNLFDRSTAYMGNAWMCQDALDGTIIGGTSAEVLIVGPYNTPDRINEYTYVYDPSEGAGGKGDLYLDWIESTLLPLVKKTYRVDLQRDRLGILGSSLGGLISCYAGWTRSGVYGKVGCMSSSFWWDNLDFQTNVVPPSTPAAPLPAIYMDWGTGSKGERDCGRYTENIYGQMVAKGFVENRDVFKYQDEGATHSETYWSKRFHIPIEDLYPMAYA